MMRTELNIGYKANRKPSKADNTYPHAQTHPGMKQDRPAYASRLEQVTCALSSGSKHSAPL